jgi:crotonobetainyl-CoA:carnitine CoA-transferase CaiB-like acyl-CoA transferase
VKDPHFQARGLFERVPLDDGDTVLLPRLAPQLSDTPGETRWPGPAVGAHNREVYGELLGIDETELARLQAAGII